MSTTASAGADEDATTVEDSLAGPVAVIGAGAMGTGIAQVAAQAGHQVHLVDAVPGAAAAAKDRLATAFDGLVAKGKVERQEADATLARITTADLPGGDAAAVPPVELVVEAVVEQIDVKRAIFAALAEHQAPTTVLASNTSSLDIGAIAGGDAATGSSAVAHPERVIGLHFFNPPPLMRLVEVVHGRHSDPVVLDRAARLMRAWGKTPVHVASTPGFIVNRVARPFYGEAQRLVQAGVADPATIDHALREHAGFRMGPLELTDLIGQDVNLAVGTSVWEQTGRDPRYAPTDLQRGLVALGRLGRKSGRGVFRYGADGRPLDAAPDAELARRLVGGPVTTDPVARTLAMIVNEAVDLVHRGEASADDVDTAMRLGANYPQGPHEWQARLGATRVVETLQQLEAAFPGGRYRVSPALQELAG